MKIITFIFPAFFAALSLISPVWAQTDQKPNPDALAAMSRGKFRDALTILDKDVENHKNPLATYKLRSDIRRIIGDFQGALADVDEAIKIVATDGSLYQRRAELRMMTGRDMNAAISDLDMAIASGIKHEKVYTLRGTLKNQAGDMDGAIADFETAIALHPGYAKAYIGLSSAYFLKHDDDKVLRTLEDFVASVESSSKSPRAVKGTVTATKSVDIPQLSNNDLRVGQTTVMITGESRAGGPPSPEEMERMTDRMEQSKNVALAYIQLADAYEKKGDIDKASVTIEKGVGLDPTDFYGYEVRGKIKIGTGDYNGALVDLDKAIGMMRRNGTPYLSRGIAYLMLGREEEAQKDFDTYLQFFPKGKAEMDRRIELARTNKK